MVLLFLGSFREECNVYDDFPFSVHVLNRACLKNKTNGPELTVVCIFDRIFDICLT